ncbi:MAG: GNAT family N-acetyltransferase [Candidatus Njordarchaeia archaeon]
MSEIENEILKGFVTGKNLPRFKYRWFGILEVDIEGEIYQLYMTGNIAQWFLNGDAVEIEILKPPTRNEENKYVLKFDDYKLWKIYDEEKFLVWKPFKKTFELPRVNPVTGRSLYTYKIQAREAVFESDFEAIAELEQFHYASQKSFVAIWRCERCGEFIESNTKPICPNCRTNEYVHILEIKDSTPASRFMILELVERSPYEPRIISYVRVDPPIPRMNRRLSDGTVVKNIREKVFPSDWFHPVFWPEQNLKEKLTMLRSKYKVSIAMSMLWEEAKWDAIKESNTASARISRVVVHPDYRSDGLGKASVNVALEWIKERRIPEMRRRKKIVETIAMMARFNPFFEHVGFKYLWDTASGRPVLFYPLSNDAKDYIEEFLKTDSEAKEHKGRLCVSRFGKTTPLDSPIILKNVMKVFENTLSIEDLPEELRNVLEAFGVRHRVMQRFVLKNVDLEINPGEIVVIVGASGAGKTTLIRLIYYSAIGLKDKYYMPTLGRIIMPLNVHVNAIIPNEVEPNFGEKTILEYIFSKTKDVHVAIEVLNKSGLSDAVLYRAKFDELSTGQKERAKIAAILAEKPNLVLIDEFAAHLDVLTAMRVASKISKLVRDSKITLVVATHRPEVIRALAPDKIIFVGYGTVRLAKKEEFEEYLK